LVGENIAQLNVETFHSEQDDIFFAQYVRRKYGKLPKKKDVQRAENFFVINLVKQNGEINIILEKNTIFGLMVKMFIGQ
jgi:hypothetical protein